MPHSTELATSPGGSMSKRPLRLSTSSVSQPKLLSPTALPSNGGPKFPRIDECAHFHYETVDCRKVELTLLDEPPDGARFNGTFDFEKAEQIFWINVKCKNKSWVIRRIPGQFQVLDELLHECVYDRKFTQLSPLDNIKNCDNQQILHNALKRYISRLSELPKDQMLCAPVLHWFDMDNKGTKLVAALRETADINIPAVAAAHTVRRYTAQSADELSLEVGDMVSIIDMSDANWWRGKCKLQVGSFPSQCVKRISDAKHADEVHAVVNLPTSPTSSSPPNLNVSRTTKPIVKKHGKFMDFLRSFLVTRPTKSRLKQTGILKERVFGCDLGEYLHNCGDDVPVVVKDCTDFVEKYGIVDGIYRISGVASHVQNLRHEYDCERRPDLNRDPSGRGEQSICDPHSVAGLCKLYFRELPNPLLTYQLYNRFAEAINASEDERLLKIHDVIQQLPPPHYRTLKHLALHLQQMSKHDEKTSMHCRNLAIVWAPNLLRSRDLEAGLAAFTEARVQSVVTEFLIANADILFSDQLQHMQLSRGQKPPRPKSLMVLSGPKLISLEEAQARSKAGNGFSKPCSENFASEVPVTRSSKMSSPTGSQRDGSKPIAIMPLSTESRSSMKRRQSMDPKLGSSRQHNNFPSNPRHYSSQHSAGWRSKLGSFLKKGNAAQTVDPKRNQKRTLRRSHSDDSLLSSHSARLDDDDDDDEENTGASKSKSPSATFSLGAPTLRQPSSPRSPRPKGNIFLSQTFEPMDAIAILNGCHDPKTRTPESIPSPSVETNPSSHNPFSGLDSDFPGVMGESGLGFNPLQYSPTFSSDSGIPDLPKYSEAQDTPTPDDDICPRKSIGSLEDIVTTKHSSEHSSSTTRNSNNQIDDNYSQNSAKPKNSKVDDTLNANAKLKGTPANDECSDGLKYSTEVIENKENYEVHSEKFHNRAVTQLNDHPPLSTRKEGRYDSNIATKSKNSYYWKTEEIDSLNEISKLNCEEKTRVVPHHEKLLLKKSQPIDLPENGNYSVQYACNQENYNGRTRKSIVAVFVHDRPTDTNTRRPHSIRRSMDVPPTDILQSSKKRLQTAKQQRSVYDITRRNNVYAAWISQHQNEYENDQWNRSHYRSLSAGDELDLDKQPVPAPRAITGKPVPLPRRILSKTQRGDCSNNGSSRDVTATSAPVTPLDSYFPPAQNHFPPFTEHEEKPSLYAQSNEREGYVESPLRVSQRDRQQIRREYKIPVSTSPDHLLMAKPPPPGIVSPTDNVCASTVLSWV